MSKDTTASTDRFALPPDVSEGLTEPHNPFLEYTLCKTELPPMGESADATFAQVDSARKTLLDDLHCSDKDLPLQLARFELRCAFAEMPRQEVVDTYKSISRLVTAEKGVVDKTNRWTIGLSLVKNLSDPTFVDQGQFGTCAYSSIERMLYFHKPAHAAGIAADVCIDGMFKTDEGKRIGLDKSDLANHGFRAGRSDCSHVLQTALQGAALQTSFDVTRIYKGDQSQLRYRQSQTAGGFEESVLQKTADKETFFTKESSDRLLWLTRLSDTTVPLFGQVTGDKERPAVIQGLPQREAHPKLQQSINIETDEQLHSVLERLKSNKQLPIMAYIHTSREPFWTDSGGGEAPGAGGEKGGGHAVLITDYNVNKKLVSVDNSWGRDVDRLGLEGTAPAVPLAQMRKALK